jgi:hypothetical protein
MISLPVILTAAALQTAVLYETDFENGRAEGWVVTRPEAVHVEDTGDTERGMAMRLEASGPSTHVLLEGSEAWGPVRMEGLVFFPNDVHNYLGFIWGYNLGPDRLDFASAYVKGNDSYIRINHRYDGNPTRAMNEERRVDLAGKDAVVIGRWQPFAVEVIGTRAHIYFGDLTVPKVTDDLYQGRPGAIGLKPRVVGGDVLVDDIRVTAIDGFSYGGASRPDVAYDRTGMITEWQVLGPTVGLHPELARSQEPTAVTVVDDGRTLRWRPFPTDRRGAVVTSRVVQFRGEKTRAYFAARIVIEEGRPDRILVTSIDDLGVWVDGRFQGYYNRDSMAWHDFLQNPDHRGQMLPEQLEPGEHWLVVEVRGALYAGGGFWAGLGPVDGSFERQQ